MSLKTFSQFYYGQVISEENSSLDFSEGGPVIEATLNIGDFTLNSILQEVENQLNLNGDNVYTVTVDRDSRLITISANANFELLITGPRQGSSVFELLGFTGSNRTGASSYTGNAPCGSVYRPQFILQDHIDPKDWAGFVDPAVNISSAGIVQVVRFGNENFLQCNIKYATNEPHPCVGPIENNPSGYDDLREFMLYLIQKNKVEFMPNRSEASNYDTFILESTEQSNTGTAFKLKELYTEGLPFHYETGVLKFRRID